MNIPDITLIIGTDAAGKDHIAGVVERMIHEAGYRAEKRKHYLTGTVTRKDSSAGKTTFELFLEKQFIRLFPFFGFLLPKTLTLLLQRDLKKFVQPDEKLVIVGHNCLRGLAFYWGHHHHSTKQIPISRTLSDTLMKMRSVAGLHILVLDIDHDIRKERIEKRMSEGNADIFDRYMVKNQEISERIEDILVWFTQQYLGAQLIKNNDLPEKDLRRLISFGFKENDRSG